MFHSYQSIINSIQRKDDRVVWRRHRAGKCGFAFFTDEMLEDKSSETHEVVDATTPHKFVLDIDAADTALDHKALLADIVNAMELYYNLPISATNFAIKTATNNTKTSFHYIYTGSKLLNNIETGTLARFIAALYQRPRINFYIKKLPTR